MNRHYKAIHPCLTRRAFTLVEMILAVAVMTVLLGGMASAILVASRALPGGSATPDYQAAAAEAVERISWDLALATTVSVADPDTVEVVVPDRGHDAAGPETIEYSWSGTPGDPLTQSYNGSAPVALYNDVQAFSLEYLRKTTSLTRAPRVLFMVADDVVLTAQETTRRDLIESWGFGVLPQLESATAGDISTAVQDADVIYVPMDALSSGLDARIASLAVGLVCEERAWFPGLGLSTSSNWHWTGGISIVDDTHEITRPFGLGPFPVFTTADYTIYHFGTFAPGGQILCGDSGYDMMMAVDVGAELLGAIPAPARRVALPWGDRTFDFNHLSDESRQLLRRTIVWAAAPMVISSVRITLQLGTDSSGLVVSEVQLLNVPEAP